MDWFLKALGFLVLAFVLAYTLVWTISILPRWAEAVLRFSIFACVVGMLVYLTLGALWLLRVM